jgi:hypothetical protein
MSLLKTASRPVAVARTPPMEGELGFLLVPGPSGETLTLSGPLLLKSLIVKGSIRWHPGLLDPRYENASLT